jgi:hypothetical protein
MKRFAGGEMLNWPSKTPVPIAPPSAKAALVLKIRAPLPIFLAHVLLFFLPPFADGLLLLIFTLGQILL